MTTPKTKKQKIQILKDERADKAKAAAKLWLYSGKTAMELDILAAGNK